MNKWLLYCIGVGFTAALSLCAQEGRPLPAQNASQGGETHSQRDAKGEAYVTPPHLRYPYIASHYIKPIVQKGEDVRIGWYVTDWRHSEARFDDHSPRFDVFLKYTVDFKAWKSLERKNVPTGDGEFDLGRLPPGLYTVGLMCVDRKSKLPSYTSWQEFRVEAKEFFSRTDAQIYRVTADDLRRYGVLCDPGAERKVYVEMGDVPFITEYFPPKGRKAVHEECLKRIDKYLAAHPHKDGRTPGYAVYIPTCNGTPVLWGHRRCRVVYDRGYDIAAAEQAAVRAGEGLQRLIREKASAGFRQITLARGVYRVSSTTPIIVPPGVCLDMNGATLKMNQGGISKGVVQLDANSKDSSVKNGIIEGDYYTHDYSQKNCEAVHGLGIFGSTYCTVENMTIRDIVGYGIVNSLGTTPVKTYPKLDASVGFEQGGLDWLTGKLDAQDKFRYSTQMVDIGNWKPFRYLSVSKYLGYQGRLTKNWNYTVCFYGADGKFISGEVAMQYHWVLIPEQAATARFSIEVPDVRQAQKCGLVVGLFGIPRNCVVRGCHIERVRCCGGVPAAMKNFLYEDNEFCHCGEELVSCAIDCEDGWDQMQDAFFFRNTFHDNPLNDFVSCSGHNMVLIGNRCPKIHLYPHSYSPAVLSNSCEVLRLGCADRNETGYWRYAGNDVKKELALGGKDGADWFSIVRNRRFVSQDTAHPLVVSGGQTGVFKGCTFDGVAASPGSAIDCVIRHSNCAWRSCDGGRWKNCLFEDGKFLRAGGTNLYQNCTFRNVRFSFPSKPWQIFDGCTFENVSCDKGCEGCGCVKANCLVDKRSCLPAEWFAAGRK